MCKVFIGEREMELGFLLYNHLYNRKDANFTTKELIPELSKYKLDISQEKLQNEIDVLINNGIVSQRVGHYTCLF